jgi:hypothetical protein
MINKCITVLLLILLLVACKTDTPKTAAVSEKKSPVKIPAFNSDNAYDFVAKQVDFGIRLPGTPTHTACKEWIVEKMESYGADVIEQDFTAQIYTGDRWASTNIICQFNPEIKDRIILSAHWDTRFKAEQDPDKSKRDQPILGADDAGSGVGVLMEIARIISENPIGLGVDIIFWDAEDQGDNGGTRETWCLGSQYWSKNKHIKNYRAKYGINVDMVGAKNPMFGKDFFSQQYAKGTLDKVWSLAQRMGYSDMFVDKTIEVLDDHYFVNTLARIPMIDIINNDGESFQKCWHTHCDDLSVIDKRTLRVVGQVLTAAIYKESTGNL